MDGVFIQEQNEIREDYKFKSKISEVGRVLRSQPTKGVLFLFVFAIVVPVLVYYFIIDRGTFPVEAVESCSVKKSYRISCGESGNHTFEYCSNINCCFDNSTKSCFHYLPSKYYYYRTSAEDNSFKKSLEKTPFGKIQEENVRLTINEVDENTIEIILHDANVTFESNPGVPNANYNYTINETISSPQFAEIFRRETGSLLLSTSRGPTIVSDGYWEWSFQLTEEYLFGLGQTLIDLDENSTLTKVIYGNDNDHNTLPSFLAYQNGSWHGLIVRHYGPLEVTVLPSKLVSLKSLVGKKILLELSIGPSIKDVMRQQNKNRMNMADLDLNILGVHICREGNSVNLRSILSDYTNEEKMEYESDCLHENLIFAARNERNTDTLNNMVRIINEDITIGKFVLALPPQVILNTSLYEEVKDFGVFFKSGTDDYKGKYLNTDVVYPYFNHPNISRFVESLILDAKSALQVWPNSVILTKNWPSDNFTMSKSTDFQYLSEELIGGMSLTLPWNVTNNNEKQFIDHLNYGHLQLDKINTALNNSTLMWTASHTFDTTSPIVIQNVNISWTNFQKAINATLFNGLFGFPLTSVPVCGSTGHFNSSHESLCLRWYLMAATAPIFRISSDLPRRDPKSLAAFSNYAANIALQAVELRKSLIYYFYNTLTGDEPLMRPMFYDFPEDVNTFGLVEQYMVGRDILVAHPTVPDQSQIKICFPRSVTNWYEFSGGGNYGHDVEKNGWVTLNIVESDWVAFIREGAIIPLITGTEMVETEEENIIRTKLKLKIGLRCDVDINCNATGTLKINSFSSFTFTSDGKSLVVENVNGIDTFVLSEIEVFTVGKTFHYKLEPERILSRIDVLTFDNGTNTS